MHAMIESVNHNKLKSMHMPGHCGNQDICEKINTIAKLFGLSCIECTTDDYFGHYGNYIPASGPMKKA